MNEMKIVIEGMAELTEAIRMLAGKAGQQAAPAQETPGQASAQGYGTAGRQTPPYQQVPVTSQIPVTPPVQPAVPVTGQMQTPVQSAVPTTATVPTYTLEQLQVAAAGLMGAGRGAQVMGILQRFGIQAMTELAPEHYGEFGAALREAGAQL